MSKKHLNVIKKISFAFLTLLTVSFAFLPMLQIETTSITILDIAKSPAMLMEFGKYKSELPIFLFFVFLLALLSYLVATILVIADTRELAFLFVLLGFLGNVTMFVFLLPPLIPAHVSYFTGYLFCYAGFCLTLLIYSFCLIIQSGFKAKLKYMYVDSVKQLSVTRNLVICAMMAALAIILNYTVSFYITPHIKIGFSGLPNRIVDYLFGPTIGMIFGGVLDILKFITKPEGFAFFFGYTITAMLGGLIYGTFYYNLQIKKPHNNSIIAWVKANVHTLLLILIAQALVKIFLNICLNTLWDSMTMGKTFWALLPARTIKNLVQIPTDTVLHFFVLATFQQFRKYLLPDITDRRKNDTTSK